MSATSTRIPGGMPSTTTPTPGPCDSPKVVTLNSWPNEEDIAPALSAPGLGRGARGAPAGALRGRPGVALRVPSVPRREERLHAAGAERLVVGHHALELVEVGGA